MFAFVISRILQALPVMLVVSFISFAMFAYVGDPVSIMLGQVSPGVPLFSRYSTVNGSGGLIFASLASCWATRLF